ncbi:hypothetical protein DSO57_1015953 [Entomophthora muscae]|uniref:Uncharacterized protein n=1 Tax=Entomophthora muscae TaxID=34485 RepID=A0ACC2SHS8_9FUNG|nr:hypothetical protein DSO57_1015953 [Entomophthora muscae]
MCALEYPTSKITLKYCTHLSNMKCSPMACPASEGLPLLETSAVTIPPGSQAILDSQISYKFPVATNPTVMIHMFGSFAGGAYVGQAKACLVGNIGLPGADVAFTQKKKLAALGYSASPCRKLWLQKGED